MKSTVAKPKAKPASASVPEDAIFRQLYCAAITGICSQIEVRMPDPDWYKPDSFAESDSDLREREEYLVDRAYRLAKYARSQMADVAEVSEFSDSL